jgi:hypothetical protein
METEENTPPEIVTWTDGSVRCDPETLDGLDEDADPMCFVGEQMLAYVTAYDADGDTLGFTWELSLGGLLGDAQTTLSGDMQVSQVTLYRAGVVNGEELRCTVSDGSRDRVTQTWTLRVI